VFKNIGWYQIKWTKHWVMSIDYLVGIIGIDKVLNYSLFGIRHSV